MFGKRARHRVLSLIGCLPATLYAGTEFSDLTCLNDPLLFSIPHCHSEFRMLGNDNQWKKSLVCGLENNLTLYGYQNSDGIFLDIKGLSGNRSQENHTETFQSCEALYNRVQYFSWFSYDPFEPSETREIFMHESVALVASQKFCDRSSKALTEWMDLLRSEQRSDSQLVCIPQKIVDSQNPGLVRLYLKDRMGDVHGMILLGQDIPPFEYFSRSEFASPGWSDFYYGQTDLPYGAERDDFWKEPIRKNAKGIREIVYKSKDFLYPMSRPTPFTYDLDIFYKKFKNSYRQKRWVSRWLAPLANEAQDFERFVAKRKDFKPAALTRFELIRGGEDVMFRPGEHEVWNLFWAQLQDLSDRFPKGSSLKLFTEADLQQMSLQLDPAVNLLVLSEHGHSQGLGNLLAGNLTNEFRFPARLAYDSCLTGAWGYADSADSSMIAQTFHLEQHPLVILASNGVKSLPSWGNGDYRTIDVFLKPDFMGQSFGDRQRQSFNRNYAHWLSEGPGGPGGPAYYASQLFHGLSLYGDGTIEF